MNQEIMQMLSELNQQHETIQEQIKIVDQQLIELSAFSNELLVLENQTNTDILAPLGKSVFAPVRFNPSEKFFVEIGAGYFVRKNLAETKMVVDEQSKRLREFQTQLSTELNMLTARLEQMLTQMQPA